MKLVVVSDVHGRYSRLRELMDMHSDADGLIFLGDGLRDLDRADAYSYRFTVYAVRGNCDGLSLFGEDRDAPEELMLSLGGFRFFAIHGHTRGVKSGTDGAVAAAHARGADVLLYGHTHLPEERYLPEGSQLPYGETERRMWIFNPGSLGYDGSFGLIQIKDRQLLLSHGRL